MKLQQMEILLAAMVTCLIAQVGCVPSGSHSAVQQSEAVPQRTLSPDDAAALAAKLANQECERQFQRQPFKAGQHAAILQDGFYHWGKLDVGAVGGLSAVVWFRQDGRDPHVEVYFSSDTL